MRKGFTLIELMIVIAIIAIIAAIAIPNLLSARKSANESRAIGNMRTLYTQQAQLNLELRPNLYPLEGTTISNGGSCDVGSYIYTVSTTTGDAVWEITADPKPGAGNKYFYVNATGIIRFILGGTAAETDTPIE